jgi:hypothetical protein
MPVPEFDEYGLLPQGIHNANLEELRPRFGHFKGSDRRPRLWEKLVELVTEAKACGLVEAVCLDGSFATAVAEPNDVDLVIVLRAGHDFSMDLTPDQYQILAQRHVRRRFGFDILVVENGSETFEQAIAFFQQVKHRPGLKNGIVRIML